MKKIKDPVLFEKIREFLTEYMPVLRRESDNTVSSYRYTINIYLEFLHKKQSKSLSDVSVKDFNQKNIMSFIDWLSVERGNKVSTINLRLTHMKRFSRFLMETDVLMLSELAAIRKIAKLPDTNADRIVFLTIEETKAILTQPDSHHKIGIRDRFLCICFMTVDVGFRKC